MYSPKACVEHDPWASRVVFGGEEAVFPERHIANERQDQHGDAQNNQSEGLGDADHFRSLFIPCALGSFSLCCHRLGRTLPLLPVARMRRSSLLRRSAAVGCMEKTPQLGPVSFFCLPSPLLSWLPLLLLHRHPRPQAPVLIKKMEGKCASTQPAESPCPPPLLLPPARLHLSATKGSLSGLRNDMKQTSKISSSEVKYLHILVFVSYFVLYPKAFLIKEIRKVYPVHRKQSERSYDIKSFI